MVSNASKNYFLNSLLSPRAINNSYAYGASITLALKLFLIYIGAMPALMEGNPQALGNVIIEIINTYIPLVAIALENPINGIFTFIFNVIFGLGIQTLRYEANTNYR